MQPKRCWGPTWRSAAAAWRSWPIPTIAATAIPSSAAPTAAPATASSAPCRLSGPTPTWWPSPPAPNANGSMAIPATAASTPRRSAARSAGPSCAGTVRRPPWRLPSPPPTCACGGEDCWPSRGWGASTCWPAPISRRRCGNAGGARGAPTSPSPCWPAAPGLSAIAASAPRSWSCGNPRWPRSCCCGAGPQPRWPTPLPATAPGWG